MARELRRNRRALRPHTRLTNTSTISTIPTNRGQKQRYSGSTPPRTVWKPLPMTRRVSLNSWGSCGSRAGKNLILQAQIRPYIRNSNTPGTYTVIHRVFIASCSAETAPHRLIADLLGLMAPAWGKNCLPGQRRRPAAPGRIRSHPWIRKS